MIVRISGEGQYELDDDVTRRLDAIDTDLTSAVRDRNEQEFHRLLHEAITCVQEGGKPVSHDRVLPSDVIMPPADISLEEAERFFTDEGLMQPLPA